MAVKMTRREATESFTFVLSLNFCAQEEAIRNKCRHLGYNYGYLGWNWGLYYREDIAFVGGYRNMPKTTFSREVNDRIVNELAEEIAQAKGTWEDKDNAWDIAFKHCKEACKEALHKQYEAEWEERRNKR